MQWKPVTQNRSDLPRPFYSGRHAIKQFIGAMQV
jgi:hypothetical protein